MKPSARGSFVGLLKLGEPLLLFLFYAFDNGNWWFRVLWRFSDMGRRLIRKLPSWVKHAVTDLIALVVYLPFVTLSFTQCALMLVTDSAHQWNLVLP